MQAVLYIILTILDLYWWVIIVAVIFSWLLAFNVINQTNQFVQMVWGFVYQLTEPVFRRVRRFIPAFNGIDLSPIVVLLGIIFLQQVIIRYIYPNVF